MKIYLAASFSRQKEMRSVEDRLQKAGFKITSHWLDEPAKKESSDARSRDLMRRAICDLHDIRDADILVRFTDPEVVMGDYQSMIPGFLGTGARHTEVGYAIAMGRPVVVVGGHQNVFDFLPNVTHVKNVEELVSFLKGE